MAICIVASVEMVASRLTLSFDLTPEHNYSLSAQSEKIIEEIDSSLKIKVFVKKEGDQQRIRTMLEPFRRQNTLIDYEIINLDRNPGLARKHNVHSYYTTILEYRGRQEKTGFPWEEDIRSTLYKLLQKKQDAIYFYRRAGDPDFNAEQGGEHGFDFAKMRLFREGYELANLSLEKTFKIPEQMKALAIVGPSQDYNNSEIEFIRSMIQQGVSVLFFLDPVPLPNLEKLVMEYGFHLPRKIVVDKEAHPAEWDDYTIIIPYIDKRHAIAQGLDLPAVFPLCRPVQMASDESSIGGRLIATGETSWATARALNITEKMDFNPKDDQKGPITVGMAREILHDNGKISKICVFGNARFFDNSFIKLLGNGKLFVNTFLWATEQGNKKNTAQIEYGKSLFLSAKEYREIQLFCLLFPLATMSIGIGIFIKRRRW